MGYSQGELDDIQARWGLRFPPDLCALLGEQRPLGQGPGVFDWVRSDAESIRSRIAWPFESFWFDVENSDVWWPEWGERPVDPRDQCERLREVFAAAPRLIPLLGHRYLPEEPCESGNPVFSVYQTDVIHYGADLADWLLRENGAYDQAPWPAIKPIRFWSLAVERNNGM
jgi:hypothetical protein